LPSSARARRATRALPAALPAARPTLRSARGRRGSALFLAQKHAHESVIELLRQSEAEAAEATDEAEAQAAGSEAAPSPSE